MRCLRPYIAPGKVAWPCGQCIPCRANRRRIWTHRMMLERFQHEHASFVTLTYDPANVPENGSLAPAHLQAWLKRFRERISPQRIRFFAVGEYGDRSERPHYHAAVYGFRECLGGYKIKGACQCSQCSVVRETWKLGHVLVGELSFKSAAYVAGYVVKKMTARDHPALNGRHPEFARMSNRPGIGANAMWDFASVVLQHGVSKWGGDVPVDCKHGSKSFPFGRYLRNKLREYAGLLEGAPPHVLDALRSGLLPVFEGVETSAPHARGDLKRLLVQDAFEKMNEQFGRNIAAKGRKRGSI